ncbi:MAG: hypothetical protein F4187_10390 [Gemmatimonadetes bacterium]|nr:hypothetical protein [Gemmatimonadota bacterium]
MKVRPNPLSATVVALALGALLLPAGPVDGSAAGPRLSAGPPSSVGPRAAPQDPPSPAAGLQTLHKEADEAISKIFSPFCPGQMLETCPSETAAALRDSINTMAHGGMAADSIIELVLAAHGEEYRAFPKRTGTGLLAWAIPPAVLVAGLAVVVLALRRLVGPAPARAGADLTDEQRERLDAALAELEEMEELE